MSKIELRELLARAAANSNKPVANNTNVPNPPVRPPKVQPKPHRVLRPRRRS